jgi:hypothetical protein
MTLQYFCSEVPVLNGGSADLSDSFMILLSIFRQALKQLSRQRLDLLRPHFLVTWSVRGQVGWQDQRTVEG